jgi:hypothetical protein
VKKLEPYLHSSIRLSSAVLNELNTGNPSSHPLPDGGDILQPSFPTSVCLASWQTIGKSCGCVRFEVFTAVTMKNVVFWDVKSCGSYVSEERLCSMIRVKKSASYEQCVFQLLVAASVVLTSPILCTLMTEEISSSETSALRTATRRNIPDDGILHSHRSAYIALTGWAL